MSRCPNCSTPAADGGRFCSACGADLRESETLTRTSVAGPGARTSAPRHSQAGSGSRVGVGRLSTSDTLSDARFLPGVMIGRRYRIIGLLGKGGMGEVYRADDLTLGQPVALKFLPVELSDDPGRLQRFMNEVRVARQVSHANVCRVFDIGEFEGQHYISMEYVDGEDLADLLRRVGRFSEDKAVQIARQICAGLAAAHAKGIVHRDLKPANVMLDGEGHVRITDFGLAGIADAIEGAEIRVGTPAYMSPEQLTGKEVTLKSDIYSLGLLLYELFTGKPAFSAPTMAELIRQHQEATPSTPSSLVPNFDPAVERALTRCLEKDPAQRPASALAVAAALPGGDALAAALAAGETPSPQMVADAGEVGGLRPGAGLACLLLLLAGIATLVGLSSRLMFPGYFPDSRPPLLLRLQAEELVRELGYTDPPADTVHGMDVDGDYLQHVLKSDPSADRWHDLHEVRPAPLFYWYRRSPRSLVASRAHGPVTFGNPPLAVSGMVRLKTDTTGRLIDFAAVPPEQAALADSPAVPDWAPLFRSAGLDPAAMAPVAPEWNPLLDCDVRRAWTGAYPGRPEVAIRAEAGGFDGRAVYFTVVAPWTRPDRTATPDTGGRTGSILSITLLTLVVGSALLMARRNLKAGRGDRRSAFRMGAYVFCLNVGSWLLLTHHVASLDEIGMFVGAIQAALFIGTVTFVFYLAVEPYIRRMWPQALISWSRLFAGRAGDPLVGRDLLLGSVAGTALALAIALGNLVPAWAGKAAPLPATEVVPLLQSPRVALAALLNTQLAAIVSPVGVFLLIFILRLLTGLVTRKTWPAVAIAFAIMTAQQVLSGGGITLMGVALAAGIWALIMAVILRLGLLATSVTFVFANTLLVLPLTADPSAWWAGRAWTGLALLIALACYGFWVSLAGRRVFNAAILDEP